MKFSYRLKIHRANGQIESSSQDYSGAIHILGRGGNSTIIIQDKSLALEHAKFDLEEEGLFLCTLSEKDSVLLNSEVVSQRCKLAPADKLNIGERTFEVFREQNWGISEERFEKQTQDNKGHKKKEKSPEEEIAGLVKAVNIDSKLPSILSLSLAACILVATLFLVMPLLGYSKSSLSSGQVSNHHRMIAVNCSACHMEPFTAVQDKACLSCHNLSDHAKRLTEILKVNSSLTRLCTDCHFEHRSNHGLIISDSRQCSDCHSKLKSIDSQTSHPNIANFDTHPEFSVSLALPPDTDNETEQDKQKYKRVKLDNAKELIDPTHLKLNHKIHLKEGLAGPEGRTTLYCRDCHKLSPNFRTIEPMSFDKNCRSCHKLEFDERLPGVQVPHAEPDTVYNFIYAEFAKLILRIQDEGASPAGFDRFRPGQVSDPQARTEYVRKYVEAETRVAEKILFTRTACHLCHDVTEQDSTTLDASSKPSSQYQVLAPNMPARWMPASTFSHGAHEEARCESCHSNVRDSIDTKDVLLPGIATCHQCHADQTLHPKVGSNCTLCHSYHDSLEMPADKKRTIKEIISALP